MFLLKALIGIAGRDVAGRWRIRGLSCGKRWPRPLFFERLEDRFCLSTWSDPINLGPVINGAGIDNRRPAISNDGLSIYFDSTRPGAYSNGIDIWVSHRTGIDDPWGEPQNLGPAINDPRSTESGAPTLSRDQHWLFYSSDRPDSLGFPDNPGFDDLYASYRPDTHDDLGWQSPINLGPGVNTAYDDSGPTYFEDTTTGITTLYFTSNRPGSVGDYDIYASTLQGFARFGPAVLVPELSSPKRDTRTAIRSDGLEIFITSKRDGGLGSGLNIWDSTRASTLDPWSTPVNLGAPINMEGFNDGAPALSSDGNTMYFYSNRPGGFGVFDLYMSTRLDDGPGPAPAGSWHPGVAPSIVLVTVSLSGSDDRGISGNIPMVTAGQATLQTRESQGAVLDPATRSPVPDSLQRQTTDRFFAARPRANSAREALGWGTASELDLSAFGRLGEL